jgi:predicted secreted protein
MFHDGRSKKVVFIAHCLLNQNAISDGTAVYPAAFKELVDFFLNADIGIAQMPCPEFCCLGLDRGNIHGAESPVVVENTRIRSEMKKDSSDIKLTKLADYIVQQIVEYQKYGFEIIGVIGANRSPNCGVETTSDNNTEINGMGLFMEKISRQLARENISVPMIGIKGTDNIQEKLQPFMTKELRNMN